MHVPTHPDQTVEPRFVRTGRCRSRRRGWRAIRPAMKHRRGAEIIEMAFVLPILILLSMGIIEFGRGMIVEEIITNAAREGARRAVVAGASDAAVYQTVDNYLADAGISGFTRTVTPSVTTAAKGSPLTVNVSVPYTSVHWGVLIWLDDNTLEASAVMRKE